MTEYNYAITTYTIDISTIGDITTEQGKAALAQKLGDAVMTTQKALETLDGGGFEITSHDMTFSGLLLLLSFLLRRPKNYR